MHAPRRYPQVSSSQIRRIAVEASCDPRTIVVVLEGGAINTLARERALAALVRHGWMIAGPAQPVTCEGQR